MDSFSFDSKKLEFSPTLNERSNKQRGNKEDALPNGCQILLFFSFLQREKYFFSVIDNELMCPFEIEETFLIKFLALN
jgi:hypothetical protein